MIASPPVFATLTPEMKARLDRFRDEHAKDPIGGRRRTRCCSKTTRFGSGS